MQGKVQGHALLFGIAPLRPCLRSPYGTPSPPARMGLVDTLGAASHPELHFPSFAPAARAPCYITCCCLSPRVEPPPTPSALQNLPSIPPTLCHSSPLAESPHLLLGWVWGEVLGPAASPALPAPHACGTQILG